MKISTLPRKTGECIINWLKENWPIGIDLGSSKGIMGMDVGNGDQLLFSENIKALKRKPAIVPFLGTCEILKRFPKIVVDSGAVRHVCNGADVMRPGILSFPDSFNEGDIVVIQEGKHEKYIAVGLAILSSSAAKISSKGVVINNMHYVGDATWEASKEIPMKK